MQGVTVPVSSALRAPVAEMVDAHGLQPCDHSGRPGPTPGWGTNLCPSRKLCDIKLRCVKNPRRNNERRASRDRKKNGSSLRKIRKTCSISSSRKSPSSFLCQRPCNTYASPVFNKYLVPKPPGVAPISSQNGMPPRTPRLPRPLRRQALPNRQGKTAVLLRAGGIAP